MKPLSVAGTGSRDECETEAEAGKTFEHDKVPNFVDDLLRPD